MVRKQRRKETRSEPDSTAHRAPMFLWRQPCRLQKGGCGRHARHYRYCSGAATVGKSDCLSALIERRYRKQASVTGFDVATALCAVSRLIETRLQSAESKDLD